MKKTLLLLMTLWLVQEVHAQRPDSITIAIQRKVQLLARDSVRSIEIPQGIDQATALHLMKDGAPIRLDIKHSLIVVRFQPLPFMGDYEQAVSYYSIVFENGIWHVSRRVLESKPLTQERDRLGWFFASGLIILFLLLWWEMPKKDADREEWMKYRDEVYPLKYLGALILPTLYLMRLYEMSLKPNVWLVISFIFWIVLLVFIGLVIKHVFARYRIAQKRA